MFAVTATWLLLLGICYLIPFTDLTSGESVVRLVLGIGAFVAVLAWQLLRVRNAGLPGLRAVQALGGAIPLFLVAFAVGHLSLAQADATHFSEPLDHTGALYLTVTIFSTVGFGDITRDGGLALIVAPPIVTPVEQGSPPSTPRVRQWARIRAGRRRRVSRWMRCCSRPSFRSRNPAQVR